jgi:hypothetical protein
LALTRVRYRRTTPEVKAASAAAGIYFSVIIRATSVRVAGPPEATFISLNATTCCVSTPSRIASVIRLNQLPSNLISISVYDRNGRDTAYIEFHSTDVVMPNQRLTFRA